MRNKVVLALVAAGLIVAATAFGCSEAGPRRDGRQLREAVEEADQLYRAALGMLGNPYYEDPETDERVTYLEDPTQQQLERFRPVSRHESNPDALELLTEARQGLQEAIRSFDEAGDKDKANAQAMLGRITTLAGSGYSQLADRRRREVRGSIAAAQQTAATLRGQEAVADYYQGVIDRSDEDVEEMIDDARAEAEQLGEELDELEARIEEWEQERSELIDANTQLHAQARRYRVDYGDATGEEAVELLESALEAEAERYRNETRIDELEYRLEQGGEDRKRLEIDIEAAENRLNAAEDILQARQGLVEADEFAAETVLSGIRSEIEQLQSRRDEYLQQAVESIRSASEAESGATEAFDLAQGSFEHAARLAERAASAAHLASQADALKGAAGLNQGRLSLQERIDSALAQEAGDVRELLGYLEDVEELRDATVSMYEESVELYSRAADRADPERRWVYEAETVVAAIALYRFTGSDEHRQLVESALEDIDEIIDSPHLRAVSDMVHLMDR